MDDPVKILCVDDEKNVLKSLQRLFLDDDYEILTAQSGENGLQLLEDVDGIQLVISDYRMPGMNGVDFLRQVHSRWPEIMRIVLSGYADTASIVAAINEGRIYRFIAKPWEDEELKVSISKALEVYFLRKQNEALADELMVTNDELRTLNSNLEHEVVQRTSDIRFQNMVMSFTHSVMDALPVAVLGVDASGLIALSNVEADKILSNNGQALVGKNSGVLSVEVQRVISDIKSDSIVECDVKVKGTRFRCKGIHIATGYNQEGKIVVLLPQ